MRKSTLRLYLPFLALIAAQALLVAFLPSQGAQNGQKVARQIRTGQVEVNGGSFNPLAPFGGYKQSGNGRELGSFGLEEYLEVKSLQL